MYRQRLMRLGRYGMAKIGIGIGIWHGSTPVGGDSLLMEDGFFVLLETGDKILL